MKIVLQVILFLSFALLLSCTKSVDNAKVGKEFFSPDWSGIDTSELDLKIGQVLKFNIDNQEIEAVVLDFDKDDKGIWYGICFINNNKLFGRQIPAELGKTSCVDLLDLTYLNDKELQKYELMGQADINMDEVGIGSISPVMNYSEILTNFKAGFEQRKKKQTPCEENLTSIDAVRECYFDFEKIKLPGAKL